MDLRNKPSLAFSTNSATPLFPGRRADDSAGFTFLDEPSGTDSDIELQNWQPPSKAPSRASKDDERRGLDPNIVDWDGDDDPENPYNWLFSRKCINCGLVCAMAFIVPLASSIFAPGVPEVLQEFHSDSVILAALVVSVYVLGGGAGPLIVAPLSEIYGRVIVYHICNVGFVAFLIACALAPNLNALIVLRLICGIFGSAPLTNGGGTIADVVVQEKRGGVIALYSLGPLLGPVVGPIAGGFLAEAKGWRWTFWVLAIAAGAISLAMLVFLKETYSPVLLERKARRLRKETSNNMLRSKLDSGLGPTDFFKRGLVRPVKMLFRSPIIVIMAIYTAITYGYLYIMFTSITEIFESTYGFSTSTAGLAFLGLGVGSLLGIFIFSATSDRYLKKKAAEPSGMKPEHRLQLLPVGAAAVPAGLFIYGWTAQYGIYFIVPIIGTGLVGIGLLIVFLGIQTYLVDAFAIFAASALATNTIVRSIAGGLLPLVGLPLYNALGYGWGNSVLGFIAVALFPASFAIQKYGEYLRNRFTIHNL